MYISLRRRYRPSLPSVGLLCLLSLFSTSSLADRFAIQASPRLTAWVNQALSQHPEMLAAQAAVRAAQSHAEGAGLPIYNPELELEYERTDINLLTAGVSQTLDWHDKQGARAARQTSALTLAKAQYREAREQFAAELISILAVIASARKEAELVGRQVDLLARFQRIARQRANAGDLTQAEVELAQLAMIEGELSAARSASALAAARQALLKFAVSEPSGTALPKLPPLAPMQTPQTDALLRQHPNLAAAMARSQQAQSAIRLADAERRADPTLRMRGGREGDQTLIGLQLSIPLQVRNRFRSDVAAARAEADQSTQQELALAQTLRAQMQASHARYAHLAQAWQLWEDKGSLTLKSRVQLLEKLWRAGELSTADYLVQLKQSMETESAGLGLHRDLWAAWLDWLSASGQVSAWLSLEATGAAQ